MRLILEGLYLGSMEDARDLVRLREAGVTHIVNCTEEVPNYHEAAFTYLWLQLADPDPRMHRHFDKACAFIDEGRRKGGVLVHCFAAKPVVSQPPPAPVGGRGACWCIASPPSAAARPLS
jgi:hypothetical protein